MNFQRTSAQLAYESWVHIYYNMYASKCWNMLMRRWSISLHWRNWTHSFLQMSREHCITKSLDGLVSHIFKQASVISFDGAKRVSQPYLHTCPPATSLDQLLALFGSSLACARLDPKKSNILVWKSTSSGECTSWPWNLCRSFLFPLQ